MKKRLSLVLIAVMIMATTIFFTACQKAPTKKDDTAYTVLQITDVHIRNSNRDKKGFETIDMLIEQSQPDLIMMTGDITSENENMTAIKKFCDFIEGYKIPWAYTFGNHDAEGTQATKQEISDYLTSLEYCVYERGDESVYGYGNYYRNITDESGKVISTLYMLDSNMYNEDKIIGGYDYFHTSQIDWYGNTVKSIAKEVNGDETKVVPSIAFFHIPFREFGVAYKEAKKNKTFREGTRMEDECPSLQDDLMFEKMLEMGSTKGVFVGHDHMNNYAVDYKGIRLSYGITTDHTLYLSAKRGGTVIRIKKDGTFTQQGYHRFLGNGAMKYDKEI